MTPTLRKVIRLDSLPLDQTYYTPEGYLVDRPILTSTGIFEYLNSDGTVRRELRLPEDVFDPESLKSYKGRPIIITHDAGLVTKDNVQGNQIGTILTEGYRSGEDVRAEIIIHDTDAMKKAGLKELSLGYNLDLDETPGEWNGQHYDAIQRNIRINHLALVREARAGEQARLNIDGRDHDNSLKGGKAMSIRKNTARGDGVLSTEELTKAIEEYKARRTQRMAEKADTEEKPTDVSAAPEVVVDNEEVPGTEVIEEPKNDGEGAPAVEPTTEEKVQMVKDRRDRRDEAGDPDNMETAQGVIAQQDEDMGILFDIIDTLLAKADYGKADAQTAEPTGAAPAVAPEVKKVEEEPVIGAAVAKDGEDEEKPTEPAAASTMNADSVDAIIRTRIQLGMVGRQLNLDGLEMMRIADAKKAIITTVRPGMNLDGKSAAYIDAAYDMAVSDIKANSVKDTTYQKHQMFNNDGKNANEGEDSGSSADARERMIARMNNR